MAPPTDHTGFPPPNDRAPLSPGELRDRWPTALDGAPDVERIRVLKTVLAAVSQDVFTTALTMFNDPDNPWPVATIEQHLSDSYTAWVASNMGGAVRIGLDRFLAETEGTA